MSSMAANCMKCGRFEHLMGLQDGLCERCMPTPPEPPKELVSELNRLQADAKKRGVALSDQDQKMLASMPALTTVINRANGLTPMTKLTVIEDMRKHLISKTYDGGQGMSLPEATAFVDDLLEGFE